MLHSYLSGMQSLQKAFLICTLVLFAATARAQPIPAVSMPQLAQYIAGSDSVLVVNFWATFCKPCIEEIPFMQRIVQRYAKQKVKLLLVSLDSKQYYPVRLRQSVKKYRFTAPVWWLNETDADYFCPQIDPKWSGAIPATLMVNKARGERRFYEKPFTAKEFEQELRAVLGL
jgi:thiol-disulfide isomerase/thioredoxin